MGLTRAERQPYRQTIAIDHRMDFARQAAAGPSHRLALVPCDAGSMLMHADNGGVDHLDSGIMVGRRSLRNPPAPHLEAETLLRDGQGRAALI